MTNIVLSLTKVMAQNFSFYHAKIKHRKSKEKERKRNPRKLITEHMKLISYML